MSHWQTTPRITRERETRSRFIARRVTFLRCGAFLVISILLCVPALTRALEHTLTAQSKTGFRISKNIERPVDKFRPAQTAVDLSVSEAFELGAPPAARFTSSEVVVGPAYVALCASPVRAPPPPTLHT